VCDRRTGEAARPALPPPSIGFLRDLLDVIETRFVPDPDPVYSGLRGCSIESVV
jgi:hypothetical protein